MLERRESRTTNSGRQRLPLLRNAKLEDLETEIEYKTGACYKGQVQDNKKVGRGVFTWPNGAKYEGEFIDNARQGHGKQTFEDGTIYDGAFNEDMRHEQGTITWPNNESYQGEFFKDRRHGYGTYTWPDGSNYSGMFYMDRKEGYGAFNFTDGTKFEGLYKCDERFGPGIQTYPNQTQDVGLWHREKLVKLCGDLKSAFTIQDTEFGSTMTEEDQEKMYIYPEYLQNRTDVIHSIIHPPEQFNYRNDNGQNDIDSGSKRIEDIFSEALDARSLAVDIRAFDEAFFEEALKSRLGNRSPGKSRAGSRAGGRSTAVSSAKHSAKNRESNAAGDQKKPDSATHKSRQNSAKSVNSIRSVSTIPLDMDEGIEEEEPVLVWNNTPSCIAMQKHCIRHEPSEKNVSFDVSKVVQGDRSGFGDPGMIEQESLIFLTAAMEGDANKVSDYLIAEKVHVNVADKSGHTALLGAATRCHEEVINVLLDSGADVNKLNDEGISALAGCHVYFYPSERFKYNIAEKDGVPPEDMDKEPGYDVNEAVKGFLSNKKTAPTQERKQTHEEKLENEKITKLRKHYGGLQDSTEQIHNGSATEPSVYSKPGEKQLGTLKFKRAVRINVDDVMAIDNDPPISDRDTIGYSSRAFYTSDNSDYESDTGPDEFASEASIRNYPLEISNQLIERCATVLSTNEMVVGRARSAKSDPSSLGTVRRLAIDKREHVLLENTIRLLLRRGADPNSSSVPMPVLFFAVKASDVEAVRLLLMKGASTKAKLPATKNGLTALHIAVALPGEDGVNIAQLLLNSLADPDARAVQDDSFLNTNLEEEWTKDGISEASLGVSGGRTALHIACARDDNYKHACKVVHELLDHHANANLLCNGHSPLSLAITSGNDMAIEELLAYNADPNLVLTHGVGSALCVASSTEYEHRRDPESRLKLIDKLVRCGANILSPIPIGPKRLSGTAVDYSYYMYNLDRRIAHMPYHALSHAERETYNARRALLAHMGDILRTYAVEQERLRMIYEELEGRRSRSPSPNFVYMGSGQNLPEGMMKSSKIPGRAAMLNSQSKVSFSGNNRMGEGDIRKPLLRYCYECGRSVGVRLSACTRCKEVYYCSKVCKVKAWNARHKEECIRIGGHSVSPAKDGKDRVDSPTPQTNPDKGKSNTVPGITGPQTRIKLHLYPGADSLGAGAITLAGGGELGAPANDLAANDLNLDPLSKNLLLASAGIEMKAGEGVGLSAGGAPYDNTNLSKPGISLMKKTNFGAEQNTGYSKYSGGTAGANRSVLMSGSGKNNGNKLPKGKKLEYLGSIKLKDIKAGKVAGHLKGLKPGKSGAARASLLNKKKKPPLFIDPITGLIKMTDPITGKVTWMDNYSFV